MLSMLQFQLRSVKEAATGGVPFKKLFLKILQKGQENTCARVLFSTNFQIKVRNFIKMETLAQMFSCKFCEIFKNTFFTEHLRKTAP